MMPHKILRLNPHCAGFSLIELAIVMVIVAILFTIVAGPISNQVRVARTAETKRMMEDAKEALIGFAMANGRFPCPAIEGPTANPDAAPNSGGKESFCLVDGAACAGAETTLVQTHGQCSNFNTGFLPAATLGLGGIDDKGFLRDAWAERLNRIRYVVSNKTLGLTSNVFTRQDGMKSATIDTLGNASSTYLFVCQGAVGMTATSCGTGNELTDKTPVLLFSRGPNASAPTVGTDEQKNLDGDKLFVSHTPSADVGNEFDDIVTWISITTIISKMQAVGKLP